MRGDGSDMGDDGGVRVSDGCFKFLMWRGRPLLQRAPGQWRQNIENQLLSLLNVFLPIKSSLKYFIRIPSFIL